MWALPGSVKANHQFFAVAYTGMTKMTLAIPPL